MWLRDELGAIYADEQFANLYPPEGQVAEQPWRVAVVSIMQYMEKYTDRQAAEAMKTRIDWKYALLRRVAHGDIPGATRKNWKGGS
jgi:transposase